MDEAAEREKSWHYHIRPPRVQNFVTLIAIEMHNSLEKQDISTEMRYALDSLWKQPRYLLLT
jgi:hypothetical protein